MTTATPSTALATIQPAFTDAERLALAGFLAGYRGLTREAYALDLRQFTTWCRARSLGLFAVRRADIESFARELEARGRARATVTRRLSTIAGFYKYAVEEELLDHSPAAHVWGHTRWQRGRGGSARRGDRTPSRPSPMIIAAPVLTFFTTNYMGAGYVATPSTRAVNGGVIREKDQESAGHPPSYAEARCAAQRKAPAQRRCAKILSSVSLSQSGSVLGRENRR